MFVWMDGMAYKKITLTQKLRIRPLIRIITLVIEAPNFSIKNQSSKHQEYIKSLPVYSKK